ncbi:MAG: aminotransferase class V-fold PLP-dependent enzyme, partial [Dehalococcoidia bacterium]
MADGHEARWAWMREHTPVTKQYIYLNAGFCGARTLEVSDAMKRRIDLEMEIGPTTKASMDERADLGKRLRAATARMMGADPDEIAITGNTTEGVNIGVNGVALQAGDRVVTTNIEHGGGMIPAYWTRRRYGTEVAIVPIEHDNGSGEMIERFDQAIDDRTKLVILSEISYASGQVLPLAEITRLAHARGATVVVDGAQTGGHIPIDAHALGVDVYAIPSHKWLCGP